MQIHRITTIGMFLLLLIFLPNKSHAGAWAQKKHGYFFKVSGNYLLTSNEYNFRGEKVPLFQDLNVYRDAEFEDLNLTFYLEYGLFDRFTLIANLPIKQTTSRRIEESLYFGSREFSRTTRGFSDLTLGLRTQLINIPLAVSVQGDVKVPLGYDTTPDNDGPTLGTGEVDVDGWLLLGRSLYPLPVYLTGGVGYRRRGGRFNDEVLYNFEVGATPGRWLFKVTFDAIHNTTTPPDLYGRTLVLPLPGGGGVTPEVQFGDQHIYKLIPGIFYQFKKGWAVQAEAIHVLGGKDTIAGTTLSLGLVLFK